MRSTDRHKKAEELDSQITKLDQQLVFLESIEEWSDADGKRYDEILSQRDHLQYEYDKLLGG